ncbi:MAG: hypothetical protein WCY58_07700 [Mariniphaga sp.]|nr:hypothetical protein [Mariniphaga sp.]MDD4225229.1 hypothetical protein [Mariniphaga sp.]MDD4424770.1 hypothetical protein [Mariniphaga sp.]
MKPEELLDLLVSWDNLALVTKEIVARQEYFPVLMEIALYSRHPKSWRAAWVVDKIHATRPELVTPYLEQMIQQLRKENFPGKKRQFLKLISLHDIRQKHHSFLLDYCLECFLSAHEPVSVRVYALQVLYNISEVQTLFKPELLSIIEHELELQPVAGVHSRGKKLAKLLSRQVNRL